ncbi:Respiratory chain complex assembly or maintenance protein [Mactra antiquata]
MGLSNLSPHLHTEKCNDLVTKYTQCVEKHPVGKFLNECSHYEKAIRQCFKEEKLIKRANSKTTCERLTHLSD